MASYKYRVITTNGEADGTIDANTEDEAKQVLTAQYVPAEHGFVDGDGQAITHELISLELTDVTPPSSPLLNE